MRQRKDMLIGFETDIQDDLMNCKVLKFTLQPFVENSIIHNEIGKEIHICISAKRVNGDTLELVIEDDGSGFDIHVLEERRKKDNKQSFSSIGIHNVEERIKLYYGASYQIQIQSKLDKGTSVHVTLPLTYQIDE